MTAPADDLADWLRLARVPGVGTQGQRALLAAFGLPGHIFAAGRGALAAVV
ncbi:MAG TPA: DNA-protecting protein DprA, partial [Thauera phenylacetica]|nr:DNA-protecting protein DprA [Thauera phenylacetica]